MSQARATRRAKRLERPHDRRPNPGLASCPALRLALPLAKSLSLPSSPDPLCACSVPSSSSRLPSTQRHRPTTRRHHSFRPLSSPPPSSSNSSERAWQQRHSSASKSPVSDAVDAARATTSSRDEVSISNASELEVTEWGIHDEPGVYITVGELADGTRELRRVCFSRERFAELNAKLWWEENKERIQAQYL